MTKFLLSAAVAALAIPAAASAQDQGPRPDANGDKIVTLAEHDASIARRFAMLDGNGDGQVTQDEMRAAHEARMVERKEHHAERMEERRARMEEKLAQATPEQRAKFEERRAKREEMQGKRKELREDRREMRQDRHEAMWAETDANGDGTISLAEMQAHARQRFDKIDANGNGQIDPDERPGRRHHRGGPGGKR